MFICQSAFGTKTNNYLLGSPIRCLFFIPKKYPIFFLNLVLQIDTNSTNMHCLRWILNGTRDWGYINTLDYALLLSGMEFWFFFFVFYHFAIHGFTFTIQILMIIRSIQHPIVVVHCDNTSVVYYLPFARFVQTFSNTFNSQQWITKYSTFILFLHQFDAHLNAWPNEKKFDGMIHWKRRPNSS